MSVSDSVCVVVYRTVQFCQKSVWKRYPEEGKSKGKYCQKYVAWVNHRREVRF